MNTPIFDSGSFAQSAGTMPSMHGDTWTPDEPQKRSGKISMHGDTWTPEEPSKRTGRISMHGDTWTPEPDEPKK